VKIKDIKDKLEKCAELGVWQLVDSYQGFLVTSSGIFHGLEVGENVMPASQALLVAALEQFVEANGCLFEFLRGRDSELWHGAKIVKKQRSFFECLNICDAPTRLEAALDCVLNVDWGADEIQK
jgi:hypothetical protein